MTTATLIQKAVGDGVELTLSPAGTVKARGPAAAVAHWLPVLRAHKPEVLALLKKAASPAGLLPDPDAVAEFVQERAAIMEYDGGLSRRAAEQEAVQRAVVRFRLYDLYGDPPHPGGGIAIGFQGESIDELITDLQQRYGDRLASLTPDPRTNPR